MMSHPTDPQAGRTQVIRWVFVCVLFVFVWFLDDLPIQGTRQTPKGGYKLTTANLIHTNIGLTSMIMNFQKQETRRQYLF